MQRIPGEPHTIVLSATDLGNYLACAHLTAERLRIALGQRSRPHSGADPHGDLVRERGDLHEREQLDLLRTAAADDWVDLSPQPGESLGVLAARTAAAMREGHRLIFQATFFDGRWQGRTDFLRRVNCPSVLGDYAYEVLDTKLARQVKPHVVHQLCLYTRLVGRVQGVELDDAFVVLGNGSVERVEISRYRALHRHVAQRLERVVDAPPATTYPEPTGHCAICAFSRECTSRWRADDHLSLVAGASRDQRTKLVRADLDTVTELAAGPEDRPVPDLPAERASLLHHQARLQVNARNGTKPVHRHLAPEAVRGYARLPQPSPGDVFFDLEGDPYITTDGGIEYLWGWSSEDGYDCLWAHDVHAEKTAFEGFVDVVEGRRQRHPDLHVFHYAPHEASKLRSLALKYATRESVIDDWLRRGVLVDLYAVVRQALQIGEESYSLKKLESHHGFVRHEKSVREGGGSIIAYENWLATGDLAFLEAIREYNREDCESTASLYRWLLETMLPEAALEHDVDFADLTPEVSDPSAAPAWLADFQDLIERLHEGLPVDPLEDSPDQAERRLLGQLLLYHYRENKPQWWHWYELASKSADELVDERDAVGLVTLDRSVPPVDVRRSRDWTYRFPPQEARLDGDRAIDPITGRSYTLVSVADDHLVLRRSNKEPAPEPHALIPQGPPDPKVLRNGIRTVAEAVLAGDDDFAALRAIVRRDAPRLASGRLGPALTDLIDATLGLDGSYLAVQGPPGTGKTFSGARMIVAAIREGRRIAITANSHAAIQNLLRAVEEHASEAGLTFTGIYRGDGYDSPHGMVTEAKKNEETDDPSFELVAGTAWLLSRPCHTGAFDVLFVDEAGQFALAAAVAAGGCARNIVLLGDPQQLPQVNQASHPHGSGASVLEHLMEGRDVIPADRGVLLAESWRMHPDVCRFVSERSYAGALCSRDACGMRRIDGPGSLTGAGLRTIEVVHEGRSQYSPEEANTIATACRGLLTGSTKVIDDTGNARALTAADILVVAPYNLAVTRIRSAVPADVRVGTVDRFQGQEAPIVFFAMTSSTGEDVPRGLDFLFDRNRLNVAVSRAQCLAVLVHSPRLLEADCKSLEHMALVDGACRFVEQAERIEASETKLGQGSLAA